MDAEDYRTTYEAEVEAAKKKAGEPTSRAKGGSSRGPTTASLLKTIRDPQARTADRTAAIGELSPRARSQAKVIETLIALLADTEDSPAVRTAALALLGELSFAVGEFQPHRSAYRDALRAAATDPDRKLRERVLEILALQGDEYAQRLIVEGLQEPSQALIHERKAVQYLSYDVHGEHQDVLRDVIDRSANKHVRNGALRMLAADSGSKDLFAQIVQDKDEDVEARSISAVALQSLAPDEFASAARDVVLDDDDDDEVRAALLTALRQDERRYDSDLGAELSRRQPTMRSAPLAKAAGAYIARSTEPDGEPG